MDVEDTFIATVAATSGATVTMEPVLVATESPQASSYRHLMRALRDRASKAVATTAFRLGTFARVRSRALVRATSGLLGIRAVAPVTLATAEAHAVTGYAFRSSSRATVANSVTAGGTLVVVSGANVTAPVSAARLGSSRLRTSARSQVSAAAYAASMFKPTARSTARLGALYDEDEDELILAMYAMLDAA